MTFEELKDQALTLPLAPGVYLMRDKTDKVIYVGKAKKLKNRVCQYFHDTANHTPKTRLMVSKVDRFDVIVASSEFEALVLECSLIKRYMPKYNILLKDDKGYPYIRLDAESDYPRFSIVSKISKDGALYFGPYGSRGVTQEIIASILSALKLSACKLVFPRDIGKTRACLNYHMDQCAGWCQTGKTSVEYKERIEQAVQILSGNYKEVSKTLRIQMLDAAERLDFETAAALRNRLNAVESLGMKQLVTTGTLADTDVIGYAETESKACFTILHFSSGNLLDKEYETFSVPDDKQDAVSSLLKQYYLAKGIAPKRILLPFSLEDSSLFSQLMAEQYDVKTHLLVPQRGKNYEYVQMAVNNAREEAERVTTAEERVSGTLTLLGKMLDIEPPKRIESYDISNISGTDIVAGMIVFDNGRPKKSDYKRFKIDDLLDQDDYASMKQVIERRFAHLVAGDKGFDQKPDLVLIDGGASHAGIAQGVLTDMNLEIPVFGMVKDNRHRTRALVTPEGHEIAIVGRQSVFALIGTIQEETHNFAINYHRKLRSKRLGRSQLDNIPGVGPKRKEELLKVFKSVSAIKSASLLDLEQVLPVTVAQAVYHHFHTEA